MRVFILLLLMALIYAPGIAAAATDPSSAPAGQVKELPPELLNLQIAPQEEKKKEKPALRAPPP
jgi:hypothetical protein